jgi:hypothetical protein
MAIAVAIHIADARSRTATSATRIGGANVHRVEKRVKCHPIGSTPKSDARPWIKFVRTYST